VGAVQIMAPQHKEENMNEDELMAFVVTIVVMLTIALICFLGLFGFFSS
jgi:hypothetical protein